MLQIRPGTNERAALSIYESPIQTDWGQILDNWSIFGVGCMQSCSCSSILVKIVVNSINQNIIESILKVRFFSFFKTQSNRSD